jgi:hypothetical protein
MPFLKRELRYSLTGLEPLVALSRHELFQHLCTVVFDLAPGWEEGDSAIVVVASPPLTRADVRSIFDQIREKYHVVGIEVFLDEPDDEPLRAIFVRNGTVPTCDPIGA